jgi:hypothetical protein
MFMRLSLIQKLSAKFCHLLVRRLDGCPDASWHVLRQTMVHSLSGTCTMRMACARYRSKDETNWVRPELHQLLSLRRTKGMACDFAITCVHARGQCVAQCSFGLAATFAFLSRAINLSRAVCQSNLPSCSKHAGQKTLLSSTPCLPNGVLDDSSRVSGGAAWPLLVAGLSSNHNLLRSASQRCIHTPIAKSYTNCKVLRTENGDVRRRPCLRSATHRATTNALRASSAEALVRPACKYEQCQNRPQTEFDHSKPATPRKYEQDTCQLHGRRTELVDKDGLT